MESQSLVTSTHYSHHIYLFCVLGKEPNLVRIGEPIVIVGDLHGQLYDLIHMLEKAGDPSEINYLFLGDYVDRGIYGLEVVLILLAIKV
jgi:serine/threonine-protein phosphatase 2B catalytic subunit